MRRYQDIIASQNGYGKLSDAPLLNLEFGGQHGDQSDLRYMLSGQDYVSRNIICKVLRMPTLLQLLPNGQYYINAFKQIFETYAQTWEGFSSTLSVSTVSTPISGAGEEFQSLAKTTRQRSEPVLGLPDKYNRSCSRLFEFWIQELLADPDTDRANFYSRRDISSFPTDHLADRYSAIACFFEPDPTFKFPVKAWLCGNMFPLSSGEIVGRRDKTAEGELNQLSITFSAVTQVGKGVDELAMRILRSMNITGTNPNLKPAFETDVSADVARGDGYVERVNDNHNTFLRP